MPTWPVQSRAIEFYGNPTNIRHPDTASAEWESKNLVRVIPPFLMFYAGQRVSGLRIHKRCAMSLQEILEVIWERAGKDQDVINMTGASIYGGGYNYRRTRAGTRLSMHAFGAAIDLDPARNAFHDMTPHFAEHMWVVEAFEKEGWVWGGRWSGRSIDGMHFQAARIG